MLTFTQWLKSLNETYLTEVTQDHLKKVSAAIGRFKRGEAPLEHIFQGKKRIAFPIAAEDNDIATFMHIVKGLKLPISQADLMSGYLTVSVRTNHGMKSRKMRIAAYLQQLVAKTKEPQLERLLQMWGIVKEKFDTMKATGSSVIISRYPIDLLRMSDHVDGQGGEIESCHSPGNSFWHCAIREAQVGGAIAYAVKTSDLDGIDLEAKEIFKDPPRLPEGIVPLARLRLRRFTHGDIELLLPEKRVYEMNANNRVPGFVEAVREWAWDAQKDVAENIDPEEDFDKFHLRGGHYQDTSASMIWNSFFGTSVSGSKGSMDQSGSSAGKVGTAEQWEEMAEGQLRGHRLKHVEVNFGGKDNGHGQAWGTWEAEMSWQLDGWNFQELPDKDDLSPSGWSPDKKSLRWYMTQVLGYDDIDRFAIRVNNRGTLHTSSVIITALISDQEGGANGEGTLDFFEHFLDRMDTLDGKYKDIEESIVKWMQYNQFYHNEVKTQHNQHQFSHIAISEVGLDPNLHGKRVYHDYEYTTEEIVVGDMVGIPHDMVEIVGSLNSHRFKLKLMNFKESHPFPMTLPEGIRMLEVSLACHSKAVSQLSIKTRMDTKPAFTDDDYVEVRWGFKLDHDDDPDDNIRPTFALLKNIDDNWVQFQQLMQNWWAKVKTDVAIFQKAKQSPQSWAQHVQPKQQPPVLPGETSSKNTSDAQKISDEPS